MFLIAGPCAIESLDMVMHTADTLQQVCGRLGTGTEYRSCGFEQCAVCQRYPVQWRYGSQIHPPAAGKEKVTVPV